MALFANTFPPNPQTQILPPSSAPLGLPLRIPGLGYILFSKPGIPYDDEDTSPSENNYKTAALPETVEHDDERDPTNENTSEDLIDEQARRRRELEAEEARKGEEDWVRSGGVLRDAQGRRDWPRTHAIREELKLREIEAQILERWTRYERGWANISSKLKAAPDSSTPDPFLRFHDIPWPLKRVGEQGLLQIDDFTIQHVEDFLLETLTVRNIKYTKKDRIRSSLLRWHPDKLGNLLQRVHPEDAETVKKGMGIVMECLQRLNAQIS